MRVRGNAPPVTRLPRDRDQQWAPGGQREAMGMIIYGECVSAQETARVRISGLADLGCDLEADTAAPVPGGDVALWIGAIGPVAATATHKNANSLTVRFKEPLDGKIVEHFRTG